MLPTAAGVLFTVVVFVSVVSGAVMVLCLKIVVAVAAVFAAVVTANVGRRTAHIG